MDWSNELVMEFLKLYKEEPVIWNPRHEFNKDRSQVHEAWSRIQNKLSVDFPVRELKKKKESLMATYRKLAMKIRKSKRSRDEELYEPCWFAYRRMRSFLRGIYAPQKMETFKTPCCKKTCPFCHEKKDHTVNRKKVTELVCTHCARRQPVQPECENCKTRFENPLENESPNEDYPLDIKYEVLDVSNITDSSQITPSFDENDVADPMKPTSVNEELPSTSEKRETEITDDFAKRKDVAIPAKPDVLKDEPFMFCELLCAKLRTLNDDTREIAMFEINNLMFHLKNSTNPKPNVHYNSYYTPPGYLSSYVQQPSCSVPKPLSTSETSSITTASTSRTHQSNVRVIKTENEVDYDQPDSDPFLEA